MGLYFNEEDIQTLKSSVTPLEVAEYLGLPMRRTGSNVSILCPAPDHNDQHFGSCVISHGGRFCKCYACGRTFDSLNILMDAGNYTLYEAMCILAELSGTTSQYNSKNNCTEPKVRTIPTELKKEIGLATFSNIKNCKNVSSNRPESSACFRDDSGEYVVYDSGKWNPWSELMKNEPDVAEWLIRNKCEEQLLKMDMLEKDLRNPATNIATSFLDIAKNYKISLREMLSLLKKEKQELEDIYVEYGGTIRDMNEIANKQLRMNVILG